jgi:hypothetical protein
VLIQPRRRAPRGGRIDVLGEHGARPAGSPPGDVATGVGEPTGPQARHTAAHSAIVVALAGVLLFGLPFWLMAATPRAMAPEWVGAALISVSIAGRIVWLVAVGERRLLETTVWIFSYTFLGLAPLAQLRTGITPETTPGLIPAFRDDGLLIAGSGCLAFGLGTVAWRMVSVSDCRSPARSGTVRTWTNVLSTGALVSAAYYVSKVGFPALLDSRVSLSKASVAAWPAPTMRIIVQAWVSMSLLVALVALLELRRRSRAGFVPDTMLPSVLAVTLFVVVNPMSSPRYVAGTAILAVATSLGMYATVGRYRAMTIAAVAVFAVVFPYTDYFRDDASRAIAVRGPVMSLTDGDFDSYAQISNTALYVHDLGATHGRQALGVVLFWVPRDTWPEKPLDTGILLADFRGYGFSNLSAPLWAELFINGSWALLLCGMFLMGCVVRRLDQRQTLLLQRDGVPGVVWCILPSYLFLLLRGSLLQSMAYLCVILLCGRVVRIGGPGKAPRPAT